MHRDPGPVFYFGRLDEAEAEIASSFDRARDTGYEVHGTHGLYDPTHE